MKIYTEIIDQIAGWVVLICAVIITSTIVISLMGCGDSIPLGYFHVTLDPNKSIAAGASFCIAASSQFNSDLTMRCALTQSQANDLVTKLDADLKGN